MKTRYLITMLLAAASIMVCAQTPTFKWIPGTVGDMGTTPGYQMNADVGPDSWLHIISSGEHSFYCNGTDVGGVCPKQVGYFIYDENGVKLYRNDYKGDGDWSYNDFNPAIACTPDGNSHIVVRDTSANPDDADNGRTVGRILIYWMVTKDNVWARDYVIAQPTPGNVLVAVAAADNNHVYLAHVDGTDIRLLLSGASSATDLGVISSVYAAGNRFVMKGKNGVVYFASGNDNKVVFSWANAGPNVLADLKSNMVDLTDGTGFKGKPDLYVNNQGTAYLTYGAENSIYFNMFDKNTHQKVLTNSIKTFDFSSGDGNLWSKKYGAGYIGASNDGKVVFSLGVMAIVKGWDDYNPGVPQPDPLPAGYGQYGTVSNYYFNYSTDGGQTWKAQDLLPGRPGAFLMTGTRPSTINYIHGKFLFSYYDASWYKEYSLGIADFSSLMTIPQLGHDLTLCNLASNVLDSKITADGINTFSWFKDGVVQVENSTTTSTFTMSGAGQYKVVVNATEEQTLAVYDQTPQPNVNIVLNGKKYYELFSNKCYPVGDNFSNLYAYDISPIRDNITYTWYQDGLVIPGETQDNLFVYANGDYRIVVQEPGCNAVSGKFKVVTDSSECNYIDAIQKVKINNQISIIPNPVNESFLIQGLENSSGIVSNILVYNSAGILILHKSQDLSSPVTLPQNTPNGLYYVEVIYGNKYVTSKFVKY